MGLISDFWPKAQFIVIGVLGPLSNKAIILGLKLFLIKKS